MKDLQDPDDKCDPEDATCSWLHRYYGGEYLPSNTAQLYLITMYWALGEITGNGDLPSPSNDTERIVMACINLLGVFINAMIIGGVVGILDSLNQRKQQFYESMDNLNSFLREKRLKATDPGLCTRLRQYYLFREYHGGNDTEVWEDVLEHVSSSLQGEVADALHSHWIDTVEYFSGVDEKTGQKWSVDNHFRVTVAVSIQASIYAPFELVFDEVAPADSLLVLEKGMCGAKGRVLRKGQVFGTEVFLNEEGGNERGYRCVSLGHTMVLSVPGETLHGLLGSPRYRNIRKRVRRKLCLNITREVCLKLHRTLTAASNLEVSHYDAICIFEREFGKDCLSRVPLIRKLWLDQREALGDTQVKALRTLNRGLSHFQFKKGIAEAVEKGAKVRKVRDWNARMREELERLHSPEFAYVDKLVQARVRPQQLARLTVEQLCIAGVPLGDAVEFVERREGKAPDEGGASRSLSPLPPARSADAVADGLTPRSTEQLEKLMAE